MRDRTSRQCFLNILYASVGNLCAPQVQRLKSPQPGEMSRPASVIAVPSRPRNRRLANPLRRSNPTSVTVVSPKWRFSISLNPSRYFSPASVISVFSSRSVVSRVNPLTKTNPLSVTFAPPNSNVRVEQPRFDVDPQSQRRSRAFAASRAGGVLSTLRGAQSSVRHLCSRQFRRRVRVKRCSEVTQPSIGHLRSPQAQTL